MKKFGLKSFTVAMSIVFTVGFSANAFAYPYAEGYLVKDGKTSSVKAIGQIADRDGLLFATTESAVALGTKTATIYVYYANGTSQNSSSTNHSINTAVKTASLTKSSATGVDGYHYANDGEYGTWNGHTYITF